MLFLSEACFWSCKWSGRVYWHLAKLLLWSSKTLKLILLQGLANQNLSKNSSVDLFESLNGPPLYRNAMHKLGNSNVRYYTMRTPPWISNIIIYLVLRSMPTYVNEVAGYSEIALITFRFDCKTKMTDVSVALRPPCWWPSEGQQHGVSGQSSINL